MSEYVENLNRHVEELETYISAVNEDIVFCDFEIEYLNRKKSLFLKQRELSQQQLKSVRYQIEEETKNEQ